MKRSVVPLKRKAIKKKPLSEQQVAERDEDIQKMWKLFNEHWELKRQVSVVTGLNYWQCENCLTGIWGENKSIYHHHLLEKGIKKYEHLKYEIDNLMLLCGDCHTRTTNGYPGEVVKQQTEAAKKRYNIG